MISSHALRAERAGFSALHSGPIGSQQILDRRRLVRKHHSAYHIYAKRLIAPLCILSCLPGFPFDPNSRLVVPVVVIELVVVEPVEIVAQHSSIARR